MISTTAAPVRLDFDDYVRYTETHPDDVFELIDGVIYKLAPQGDAHFQTRSAIQLYLSDTIDRARFTPYTEGSFPAPGWADGPRPDNFVARGPWMVDGRIAVRPTAEDIALNAAFRAEEFR
jgi:Uma2 family endonuclease